MSTEIFFAGANRTRGFLESCTNRTLEFRNQLEEFKMRHPLTGSFGVLVAALAFSPIVFAQTNPSSGNEKGARRELSPQRRAFLTICPASGCNMMTARLQDSPA